MLNSNVEAERAAMATIELGCEGPSHPARHGDHKPQESGDFHSAKFSAIRLFFGSGEEFCVSKRRPNKRPGILALCMKRLLSTVFCGNMGRFDGKVVIITGSSSGMGQAAAVAFASEGASVMIHGRDEKGIQATKDLMAKAKIPSAHVESVMGSVENEKTLKELVKKTVEKFKKIDILVNAAGIGAKPDTKFDSMENFNFVIDVNLKAPVNLSLMCIPHLVKTKGCIINISSMAAFQTSVLMPFYSMAKGALDQFTRNYAVILGPKGVRVNSMNPGIVRTGFQRRLASNQPADKVEAHLRNMEQNVVPLGRFGTVAEMSDAILFIASASYMNGATLVMDGGSCLKRPDGGSQKSD